MAGLVPAIHAVPHVRHHPGGTAWMPVTSTGMTGARHLHQYASRIEPSLKYQRELGPHRLSPVEMLAVRHERAVADGVDQSLLLAGAVDMGGDAL